MLNGFVKYPITIIKLEIFPDDEYVVQINLWNGEVCNLKTIGCKSIYHRIELVDEIGDIVMNDGLYKFMTVDIEEEAEAILEIEANGLMEIE